MTGIYKITNLINGKVYIGQARNIEKRWKEHKNNIKICDQVLYRAMRKHGFENFSFEILMLCEEDLLNLMEKYYIEKYNSYIHAENSNGYNMTTGGEGNKGYKHTKKSKQKMKGQRKNIAGGNNHKAKRVVCEDIIFNCAKDCAEYYGVNYGTMKDWLNHNSAMPKEWYDKGLRYLDEEMENYKIYEGQSGINNVHSKKVFYNKIIFSCVKEFAEYCRICYSTARGYLQGRCKIPQQLVDLGFRYATNEDIMNYPMYNKMIHGKHTDIIIYNQRIKANFCGGIFFSTIKKCSEYYDEKQGRVREWLENPDKMPQKYIDLGLRYATQEENDFYKEIQQIKMLNK